MPTFRDQLFMGITLWAKICPKFMKDLLPNTYPKTKSFKVAETRRPTTWIPKNWRKSLFYETKTEWVFHLIAQTTINTIIQLTRRPNLLKDVGDRSLKSLKTRRNIVESHCQRPPSSLLSAIEKNREIWGWEREKTRDKERGRERQTETKGNPLAGICYRRFTCAKTLQIHLCGLHLVLQETPRVGRSWEIEWRRR